MVALNDQNTSKLGKPLLQLDNLSVAFTAKRSKVLHEGKIRQTELTLAS